jgi:hypothetical protein
MNCTFVAAEVSDHTLEAIGEMMGITREGVRLIERRALMKVRLAIEQNENDEPALCKQTPSPGEDRIEPRGESIELANKPNGFPDYDGRELAQR